MRIYTDPALVLSAGRHTTLLRPVLGAAPQAPGNCMTGRFDRYDAVVGELLALTEIEDADAVVLPVQWIDGTPDADGSEEYTKNMLAGDYVLCARGGGNFSSRLYEALGARRKPVFINTDCELPFESVIHWRSQCVWVDESEVPSAANKVAEFHERLAGDIGCQVQRSRCLEAFDRYLSPEASSGSSPPTGIWR